jgi:hypothetical protein
MNKSKSLRAQDLADATVVAIELRHTIMQGMNETTSDLRLTELMFEIVSRLRARQPTLRVMFARVPVTLLKSPEVCHARTPITRQQLFRFTSTKTHCWHICARMAPVRSACTTQMLH